MKTPLRQHIQGGLQEGKSITVKGRVLLGAKSFYVNLQCGDGPEANVALHFSARFDKLPGYVVLNSYHQNTWSKECKYESPIPRGSTFALEIMVNRDSYLTSVNGIFFLEYLHQLPPSSVNTIWVDGGIELESVEFPNTSALPPFSGYGFNMESLAGNQGAFSVASAYNQGACSGAFAYTEKATSGALAYTKGQCYGAPGFNQDLSSEAFAYTRRTFSVDSEYNQVPPPVAPAYSQAPPPVGLTYNQASLPVAPIYNQAPLPVASLYNQAPPPVAPMYNQAPPPVAVAYAEGTRGVAVAFVQGSSPDVPEKPKTSSSRALAGAQGASSTAVACSSGPPLVTPYKLIMQGGMYHGRSITVQGVVNLSAKTFFIELRYKNGVAFQLSPDFDKSRVVCSSQKWRSEERLQGLPFCKGRPFTVNILCEVTCYRISINGIQTITFKHRYSMLNEIDILEIGGDVSLTSVEC